MQVSRSSVVVVVVVVVATSAVGGLFVDSIYRCAPLPDETPEVYYGRLALLLQLQRSTWVVYSRRVAPTTASHDFKVSETNHDCRLNLLWGARRRRLDHGSIGIRRRGEGALFAGRHSAQKRRAARY